MSGKRRLHFASAGIASPGLRKSGRAPEVALGPSFTRAHTTSGRKRFDTQIGAFVLGMNETGLTAVRCLGRQGISAKGFDIAPRRAGFRSRYCRAAEVCPDPLRQPDELVRFLRHHAGEGSQKVLLLPTSDLFFLFLSRHRAQLADRFLMNLPSEELAESVVNKRRLYELAAANGSAFPQSYFPDTYDEACDVKDSLRYPAFIKPYWGHQWRRHFGGLHKGFKVQSPDEFLARFREVLDSGHPALVQSYITSPDDSLFSLSLYISQAGEVLAAFPRKQLRQYPPNSGTVSLAISQRNPELVASGTKFCQSIGYRGIAGLEYKLDREDNQYKLLDFNPRLMLSDSLTAYCGINLPLMQYLDLTSQRPAPRREYPEGVKWLDSIADFHSFKQYHERGELGFRDWLNSMRRARVFALFAWDDPLPFLIERKFGVSYGRILQYVITDFLPLVSWKSVIEIDVDVPQARLASLFADPGQFTRWMHDMERVEPLGGELGMPGSRFRLVPKQGDMVFVATVLERKLPSEVDLNLDAEQVAIFTRARFRPLSASRTRLRHEQVFAFKGLFNKLLGALSRPAMRKAQRRHMERFKRFAETGR